MASLHFADGRSLAVIEGAAAIIAAIEAEPLHEWLWLTRDSSESSPSDVYVNPALVEWVSD